MASHENHRTDAQIHDDVLQELHWETRVDETEVEVEVEQGVVTLRGSVSLTGAAGGYAKKLAAEEAARRVAGVQDIANDLQFYGPVIVSYGPVIVCFPGQQEAGTGTGVTSHGHRTLCDGTGCQTESQQVDGWLFVGSAGERRHYCPACLVPYLTGLRGPQASE